VAADAERRGGGDGAERRTRLAGERTQLAWWRTGLTALAVGVAIGRVVPELDKTATEWPYVALGLGFALYGAAMIGFGVMRGRSLDDAVTRGGFSALRPLTSAGLALAGIVLAVLTCVAILLG
jgi:putative membrane protein